MAARRLSQAAAESRDYADWCPTMNISAHVLDSTFGQPTAGTRVRLEHLVIDGWHLVCWTRQEGVHADSGLPVRAIQHLCECSQAITGASKSGLTGILSAASTGSSSIATSKHGLYRLVFDCDSYFAGLGGMTAHPEIVVVFRMPNEMDSCQVQVVLAPYSHFTYLGMTEAGWSR